MQPPLLRVNRNPEDPVFSKLDEHASVQTMPGDCKSASFSDQLKGECKLPQGSLYQVLAVAPGEAKFKLIREQEGTVFDANKPSLDEKRKAREQEGTGFDAMYPLKEESEEFIKRFNSSKKAGDPLLRLLLVSPEVKVDPCAQALSKSLTAIDNWGADIETLTKMKNLAPSIEQWCSQSNLLDLYKAFSKTPYESFPSFDGRQFGACGDKRCGMETLAKAIELTSKNLLSHKNCGAQALKAVQVTYTCETE